jgi:hypothetical protein
VSNGRGGYRCQATELPRFTTPLPWWDVRQYVRDLSTRNMQTGHLLSAATLKFLINRLQTGRAYRLFLGLYRRLGRTFGGIEQPLAEPAIPAGRATPVDQLDLCPGEWVEVKTQAEIAQTLDGSGRNRGMFFDVEMVPYCGKRFRVAKRVDRILNEATGEVIEMKTPAVILDGAVCRSEYSTNRMFCPRQLPSFWREVWLRRVPEAKETISIVDVSDSKHIER